MKKSEAIQLLGGGDEVAAAKRLGITRQAVRKWPDPLSDRIEGRILLVLAREQAPRQLEALRKRLSPEAA